MLTKRLTYNTTDGPDKLRGISPNSLGPVYDECFVFGVTDEQMLQEFKNSIPNFTDEPSKLTTIYGTGGKV